MLFVAGVSLMFRMPDRMPLTEEVVQVGQGLMLPLAASRLCSVGRSVHRAAKAHRR